MLVFKQMFTVLNVHRLIGPICKLRRNWSVMNIVPKMCSFYLFKLLEQSSTNVLGTYWHIHPSFTFEDRGDKAPEEFYDAFWTQWSTSTALTWKCTERRNCCPLNLQRRHDNQSNDTQHNSKNVSWVPQCRWGDCRAVSARVTVKVRKLKRGSQ